MAVRQATLRGLEPEAWTKEADTYAGFCKAIIRLRGLNQKTVYPTDAFHADVKVLRPKIHTTTRKAIIWWALRHCEPVLPWHLLKHNPLLKAKAQFCEIGVSGDLPGLTLVRDLALAAARPSPAVQHWLLNLQAPYPPEEVRQVRAKKRHGVLGLLALVGTLNPHQIPAGLEALCMVKELHDHLEQARRDTPQPEQEAALIQTQKAQGMLAPAKPGTPKTATPEPGPLKAPSFAQLKKAIGQCIMIPSDAPPKWDNMTNACQHFAAMLRKDYQTSFLAEFVNAAESGQATLSEWLDGLEEDALPFPVLVVETSRAGDTVPPNRRWEAVGILAARLGVAKAMPYDSHYDLIRFAQLSHAMLTYGTTNPTETQPAITHNPKQPEGKIARAWLATATNLQGSGEKPCKDRVSAMARLVKHRLKNNFENDVSCWECLCDGIFKRNMPASPEVWVARWVDDDLEVHSSLLGITWLDNKRMREIMELWDATLKTGKINIGQYKAYGSEETATNFEAILQPYKLSSGLRLSEFCLGWSADGAAVNGSAVQLLRKKSEYEHYHVHHDDCHNTELARAEARKVVNHCHNDIDTEFFTNLDRIVGKIRQSDVLSALVKCIDDDTRLALSGSMDAKQRWARAAHNAMRGILKKWQAISTTWERLHNQATEEYNKAKKDSTRKEKTANMHKLKEELDWLTNLTNYSYCVGLVDLFDQIGHVETMAEREDYSMRDRSAYCNGLLTLTPTHQGTNWVSMVGALRNTRDGDIMLHRSGKDPIFFNAGGTGASKAALTRWRKEFIERIKVRFPNAGIHQATMWTNLADWPKPPFTPEAVADFIGSFGNEDITMLANLWNTVAQKRIGLSLLGVESEWKLVKEFYIESYQTTVATLAPAEVARKFWCLVLKQPWLRMRFLVKAAFTVSPTNVQCERIGSVIRRLFKDRHNLSMDSLSDDLLVKVNELRSVSKLWQPWDIAPVLSLRKGMRHTGCRKRARTGGAAPAAKSLRVEPEPRGDDFEVTSAVRR